MQPTPKKIKVFITLPSLKDDPGGVASYYNSILPHMYKSNSLGIALFEIGSTHGKNMIFHPINDQLQFRKNITRLKPDIVHLNPSLNLKSFIRDGLFIFWAKKQKIPVITFFHGWEKKFERHLKGSLKFFFNRTYKKSDAFIVLASEFKKALREWKTYNPVHILTTNVDAALLKNFSIQQKTERIKKSNTIRFLFLSRLEKEKGIFETIDAFKLLLDQNLAITLSIAGDGSVTNPIKGYIDQLGLNDKISMLGYVRDKEKIKAFTEHDVYCFPTYHDEGMPTSVLEAMAFGMPVITTPIGGIKDFFKPGKMGYLCQTTTPEEIAENIKKLICDRNKICHIARYNNAYAQQHFMAPIVAKNLINIYCKTVKDK